MLKTMPGLMASVLLLFSCSPKPTGRTNVQVGPMDSNQSSTNTDIPAEEADPVRPVSVQAELDKIRQTLDTIALDLACTVDENCIALAADDNACGITTEWLIFSTQAPRYIEVEALLRRSFYLDNTYPNSRFQNCGGPSKPKLRCTSGQCQQIPFTP